jgi:hypothetical protein
MDNRTHVGLDVHKRTTAVAATIAAEVGRLQRLRSRQLVHGQRRAGRSISTTLALNGAEPRSGRRPLQREVEQRHQR